MLLSAQYIPQQGATPQYHAQCDALTGFHNVHPLRVSLPPAIRPLIALYYNPGKLPQPFPYSSKTEKNILLNCATFISFLAHRHKKSYHWLIQRCPRVFNAVKYFWHRNKKKIEAFQCSAKFATIVDKELSKQVHP